MFCNGWKAKHLKDLQISNAGVITNSQHLTPAKIYRKFVHSFLGII